VISSSTAIATSHRVARSRI